MSGLLEIRNLTVEFQTAGGLFRAVDSVDIRIDQGEILSIVGESGSGKSVSMLAMMGLLPWTAKISADVMEFDGHDLLTMSKRARRGIVGKDIAMIFQEPVSSLNPCFTVGFQVAEVLRIHRGMGRRERRNVSIELLEMVGIPAAETRLSAFPHQMSGGMNQRVMIAMALAGEPKLLIADEPTTALDVTIQAQILDLLVSLQKEQNMAMILITHDMGVVAETAHRVQVQYAGQKVEEQTVENLFATPRHPYTSALLAALPERAVGKTLPSIPGVVPGQYDRPDGCLFSPRCEFYKPECGQGAMRHQGETGEVLCNFPILLEGETA